MPIQTCCGKSCISQATIKVVYNHDASGQEEPDTMLVCNAHALLGLAHELVQPECSSWTMSKITE